MIPWYIALHIAIFTTLGSLMTSYLTNNMDNAHYALAFGMFVGTLTGGILIRSIIIQKLLNNKKLED
jgi:hypothetical protein